MEKKGGNVQGKTCIIDGRPAVNGRGASSRRSSVVEQLIRNQQVGGSNPPVGSILSQGFSTVFGQFLQNRPVGKIGKNGAL
jgi:hypothetical protein